MIELVTLTADMAMVFKHVRLRALKDIPTAFSSTFHEEAKLSDDAWIRWATQWSGPSSVTYLAMDAGLACGIASGYLDKQNHAQAHLASMWVAPTERRRGIGGMLVNTVVEWAHARRVETMRLTVTSNNQVAIRFYQDLGFGMTDYKGTYRNDPALTDSEMIRSL
jgi:ribosomal protein S18 acetylase RimI-like enzyme